MKMKFPYILLLFMSPYVAELCSGSSPFYFFFNPLVFLIFIGFYGCGALLIREIVAHRGLNYISVLLLGAAFGVLEEGIILRSWFDPTWMLGQLLSQVLRVYDMNVLHPFFNIVYHAVISILSPIIIVNCLSNSKDPWLTRNQIILVFIIFIISGLIMFFTFNFDYQISFWHYLLGFVLLTIFITLGLKNIHIKYGEKIINPPKIFILSAIFTVLLFIIFFGFGGALFPWYIIFSSAMGLYIVYFFIAIQINWENAEIKQLYAAGLGFISGLMSILMVTVLKDPLNIINLIGGLILVVILFVNYDKLE